MNSGHTKKRNLFAELKEGFTAMAESRASERKLLVVKAKTVVGKARGRRK